MNDKFSRQKPAKSGRRWDFDPQKGKITCCSVDQPHEERSGQSGRYFRAYYAHLFR
uniref:Uncharacterized protein n=1 Tax=Phage sp. ctrsQ3 TaxID=2826752 RepID=A0A8S5MG66_9VIRU|nr:MAG TPA: hypothetical protein [Phage sp. ctrsQ3]DAP56804.1 MAG TPA: hypothetical protein [Caudoviricetes sp.]